VTVFLAINCILLNYLIFNFGIRFAINERIMEAVVYKKEESPQKINGKPVVDGRFVLVLKNPVNGFIRRVLIAGSRASVYSAVLSFARDQWLPPPTVEYQIVNTRLPAVRVALNGSRNAALSTD
jgi:hypothetical protein